MRYVVQPGDTLYSVSRLLGIRTEQLIAANPGFTADLRLTPGRVIQAPKNPRMQQSIEVNGYAYAWQRLGELQAAFPYMTYLSIFSCSVSEDGSIACEDDDMLASAAWAANVAPLMVVSNYIPAIGFSPEIAHTIFTSEAAQKALIDNIISRLSQARYYGVNIDFEVFPFEDALAYAAFVQRITYTLHPLGYYVLATLRSKRVITVLQGLGRPAEAGELEVIADRFIFRSAQLACNPFSELSAIDNMQRILDYMIAPFSSQKILLAYPSCCQVHALPATPGQPPIPLDYDRALEIANQGGGFATGPNTNTLRYTRVDESGTGYSISCGNIIATREAADLIRLYNLGGVSFRPAYLFSLATYQMFGAMFNILKVAQ